MKEKAEMLVSQGYNKEQVGRNTLSIAESEARSLLIVQDFRIWKIQQQKPSFYQKYKLSGESRLSHDQKAFVMSDFKMKIDLKTEESEKRRTKIYNYYQAIIRIAIHYILLNETKYIISKKQ